MNPPPVIFTFGVPRSGTTFAQHWLFQLPPEMAHVVRIKETNALHPWNSNESGTVDYLTAQHMSRRGLIALNDLYADRPALFVWMRRNPIGVFHSFYAAREIDYCGLKEKIPTKMGGVEGIARNGDDKIFRFIDITTMNAEAQRQRVQMVDVWFERLDSDQYKDEVCRKIAAPFFDSDYAYSILRGYLDTNWNRKPVRSGALSYGIRGKVELPERVLEKIIKKYGQ